MNFLASIAAKVVQWIIASTIGAIAAYIKEKKEQAAIKKNVEDAVKKYEETKTPEEQENAFKDMLNKTNRPS